jgi:peptidoglycan hydrolase-like protein with peptidoglycan-binding domain
MTNVICFDSISVNLGSCPSGQRAGYATGGGDIGWTTAQFEANPGAVVIDQDPSATDKTADVLDVESGAATVADVAAWYKAALANYNANVRPGQRKPVIYCGGDNLTPVANALTAAKITDVGIWLADPGISLASAESQVDGASGSFPIIGVQYEWPGLGLPSDATYDVSVFNSTWISVQSGVAGSTVSIGSSGPAVTALQNDLNKTGAKITADGAFGNETEDAVKTFQTSKKLEVDGVAGPATWAALEAAVTPPPAPPAPKPVPATVPDVVGRADLATAEGVIKAAGFVAVAKGDSAVGNKGSVTSQDPAAGATADTGSTVTLTYTVVPDVKIDTVSVSVSLVQVSGQPDVYLTNGKNYLHVPDPTVLGLLRASGVGPVITITEAQFESKIGTAIG